MLNSIDLLVIVFMSISALSLIALLLMGLMKNKIVRRISVCIAAAITLYTSWVGIMFFGSYFIEQAILGILVGVAAIGAVVLTFVGAKKHNEKFEKIARIASSLALVAGIMNIFFI